MKEHYIVVFNTFYLGKVSHANAKLFDTYDEAKDFILNYSERDDWEVGQVITSAGTPETVIEKLREQNKPFCNVLIDKWSGHFYKRSDRSVDFTIILEKK